MQNNTTTKPTEGKAIMKASELRIGNLLEFRNYIQPHKIITVGCRFFSSASVDNVKIADFEINHYHSPIPLTEEWLLKFGLDYTSEKDYYYLAFTIKDLLFETASSMDGFTYNLSCGNQINIKHVHQLQNLYFALTGEELTINEVTYEQ